MPLNLRSMFTTPAVILGSLLLSGSPALEAADRQASWTYCVDPNWMPFERINKEGHHEGIVADFLAELAQQLPAELTLAPTQTWSETITRIRNRECDFIPALNSSPEREQFLSFTVPYIESAVVIIARDDASFLDGFSALEGKQLGIVSGYIYDELLARDHPGIKRVYTASVREAFRQVASGKLDATVASLLTATRLIQEQGLSNLKIAGGTSFSHQLRVGVRSDRPDILAAMNHAVDNLPVDKANQILQRWYTVKLEQQTDFTLLYQLAAVAAAALGLLYYRSYRIAQNRNQLGQLNNRLSDRNARLERLSQRDPLTGARNRIKLCSDLQQHILRSEQSDKPLSLALLDLTEFRKVNLLHGHNIGDLVLSEVCQRIRDNLPINAVIGRWSGDQFLLIVPDSYEQSVQTLLNGILRRVEQSPYSDQVEVQMRGSITRFQAGETMAEMLDRLEQGLQMQPIRTDISKI